MLERRGNSAENSHRQPWCLAHVGVGDIYYGFRKRGIKYREGWYDRCESRHLGTRMDFRLLFFPNHFHDCTPLDCYIIIDRYLVQIRQNSSVIGVRTWQERIGNSMPAPRFSRESPVREPSGEYQNCLPCREDVSPRRYRRTRWINAP